MKVTTRKLNAGRYAVVVDGKATHLLIEKGDAPKYRERQEWCIGVLGGEGVYPHWVSCDQTSLSGAVSTIRTILDACQPIEPVFRESFAAIRNTNT